MNKQLKITLLLLSLTTTLSFSQTLQTAATPPVKPTEKHLKNIRQLTFGGNNAEAYWSFDGKMVSFQSNNKKWGLSCDQVFY